MYDVWLKAHKGDTTALTFGNLGGGSDFAGFYHHLGIPAGGIGFDGPDGIYHSMYDSYDWMTRFGDPGYKTHRAGAQNVARARQIWVAGGIGILLGLAGFLGWTWFHPNSLIKFLS